MDVLNVLRALLFCVLLCQTSARRLPTRRHIRDTKEARFIGLGGTGTGTGLGGGLGGNNLGSNWQNLFSGIFGGLGSLGLKDFLGNAQCQVLAEKNLPLVRLANGGVYLPQTESVTWPTADRKCRELGMHLVTMETKRENDLVIDFIWSRHFYNYDGSDSMWIGLVDGDGDTATNDYQWITNGQSPSYDYWAYDDDDLCGLVYYDQDTIAEGVGWDSDPCDDLNPYMCELEGECAKIIPAKTIPYVARHK